MKGIYTALVTPFNSQGKIDFEAYKKLLDLQVKGQVNGVIPSGTTGESPTLSLDEKKELILFTIQELKNTPLRVIAGTGSNSTEESISLSKWASREGAHAVLLVAPYYNKPTQKGLHAHFKAIADAVDCEVVLYNVPGRSIVSIAASTVAQLASHPRIKTIKEASGNLTLTSEIRSELELKGNTIDILSGNDPTFLAALSLGAVGNISVASNLIPEVIVSIQKNFETGKNAEALKLHQKFYPLFRDLFIEPNPVPVKYALSQIYGLSENVRLPLAPLSEENKIKMNQILKVCELIKTK